VNQRADWQSYIVHAVHTLLRRTFLNDINISHESKTKFPVQHCTCSAQGPYRIYKNILYRTFFTKTLPDLEGHAKRKKENIREEKKRKSDLF